MIHICQMLCPNRHCIFAIPYESEKLTDADASDLAKTLFEGAVASGEINPHCHLCRSEEILPECGRTRFATMEEALPSLQAIEVAQMMTRAAFDQKTQIESN